MKIAVAGIGYVGLSNAVLLAQHHSVTSVDIIPEKVDMLNRRQSPIVDAYLTDYLNHKKLDLKATLDSKAAYKDADWIIVAVPTNYDEKTGYFNTGAVEAALRQVAESGSQAAVVIKSTIPIGYTNRVSKSFPGMKLLFAPEFLREGKALYDNLYPARIIVGVPEGAAPEMKERARQFASLMQEGAIKKDIPILITGAAEAEAVKLFANTYLAVRVAYFNELDTFAEENGLSAADIIKGMGYDPRIGDFYNNPSFGYGGYCLPKDTKQLLANFKGIPENMIRAVVDANETRKRYIAGQIAASAPKLAGIYRLTMKSGSDNFRSSAIQGIIRHLAEKNVPMRIYEPMLEGNTFDGIPVTHDLSAFKKDCDIIVANRITEELKDVKDKVYARDLFSRD